MVRNILALGYCLDKP